MMKDGIDHYFFKTTHLNMIIIGLFSRVIWLFPIYSSYTLKLTETLSSLAVLESHGLKGLPWSPGC